MADYVWPAEATPEKFALSLFSKTVRGTSMFGRNGQNLDMLNDRWKVDATIGKREPIEGAAVEAFINSMRGGVNTVQVPHFSRPRPLGTAQQSLGLVYAAPQGSSSVRIATFAGATLLTGDLLNTDGLLLQCREDCTAGLDGVITVPLGQRLRRSLPGLSRASTATYIDGAGVLQTAGVNVPRFQGGVLLVEGEGTNLILQSAALSTAPWNGASSATLAPEFWGGSSPFWSVAKTGTGSSEHRLQGLGSVVSGGTLTATVALLAGTSSVATIGLYQASSPAGWGLSSNADAVLLEGSGSISRSGSLTTVSGLSATVPTLLRLQRTYVDGAATASFMIYPGGTGVNPVGTSSKVTRVQVEKASTHSSYIPTTTAPATRAADVVTPVILQNPTVKCRLAPGTIVAAPFGRGGNMTGVNFELVEAIP